MAPTPGPMIGTTSTHVGFISSRRRSPATVIFLPNLAIAGFALGSTRRRRHRGRGAVLPPRRGGGRYLLGTGDTTVDLASVFPNAAEFTSVDVLHLALVGGLAVGVDVTGVVAGFAVLIDEWHFLYESEITGGALALGAAEGGLLPRAAGIAAEAAAHGRWDSNGSTEHERIFGAFGAKIQENLPFSLLAHFGQLDFGMMEAISLGSHGDVIDALFIHRFVSLIGRPTHSRGIRIIRPRRVHGSGITAIRPPGIYGTSPSSRIYGTSPSPRIHRPSTTSGIDRPSTPRTLCEPRGVAHFRNHAPVIVIRPIIIEHLSFLRTGRTEFQVNLPPPQHFLRCQFDVRVEEAPSLGIEGDAVHADRAGRFRFGDAARAAWAISAVSATGGASGRSAGGRSFGTVGAMAGCRSFVVAGMLAGVSFAGSASISGFFFVAVVVVASSSFSSAIAVVTMTAIVGDFDGATRARTAAHAAGPIAGGAADGKSLVRQSAAPIAISPTTGLAAIFVDGRFVGRPSAAGILTEAIVGLEGSGDGAVSGRAEVHEAFAVGFVVAGSSSRAGVFVAVAVVVAVAPAAVDGGIGSDSLRLWTIGIRWWWRRRRMARIRIAVAVVALAVDGRIISSVDGILSGIRSHALRVPRPARSLLSSAGIPHGAVVALGQSAVVVVVVNGIVVTARNVKALGTFLQVQFPTPRSLPLGHANIGMNDATSVGVERTGRIAEFVTVEGGGAGAGAGSSTSPSGSVNCGSGSGGSVTVGGASGSVRGDDGGFDGILADPGSVFGQRRTGGRHATAAVSGSTSSRGRGTGYGRMTRFSLGLMGFSAGGTAEAHAGYG